ncbi:syntenin-2 isoform X1 [Centrocercus urophasianus]|uniref:syntenin-2 isoform X1 n=2 Tax=Centrocercus urophasianus TaxID=9002 RepID=UPI001C65366E|nr:syntenin-2 isoform X1 [Centrocercus urophasianus]
MPQAAGDGWDTEIEVERAQSCGSQRGVCGTAPSPKKPQSCPHPIPIPSPGSAPAMATLYPSLEDMKGHQVLQAQVAAGIGTPATTVLTEKPNLLEKPKVTSSIVPSAPPALYPNLAELEDYMGLALSSEEIQKNLFPDNSTALTPVGSLPGQLVAPLSGNNAGLRRAEIKPGVREIHLCKDERGKTGLQLKSIDQGIFVQLVKANSPAALVGLRFGDQILQIDGKNCAGWSSDKAHRALKKASPEKIVMVVRDRPFQRTVTMHKDSNGHVGVVLKKGKIVSLAKDSSAARNGLLTHHYICEVNGQNVIGMKDKQLMEVLAGAGNIITLTIIPAVIYEHMVKRLSSGQMKSSMDHSIPDL